MANSVYIGMSSALAAEQRLEVAANNISNTNTTGFKGHRVSFSQYLVPNLEGRPVEKALTAVSQTRIDTSEGERLHTGNPLDVAIDGPGWLTVQGPQGPLLTRAGTLSLGADGNLVDGSGLPVLGGTLENPQPIAVDGNAGPVTIAEDGSITQGERAVGSLMLLEADPMMLTSVGASHYAAPPEALAPSAESRVSAGYLEGSNINPIRGMIELIEINKDVATSQKLMSEFRKLDEKVLR